MVAIQRSNGVLMKATIRACVDENVPIKLPLETWLGECSGKKFKLQGDSILEIGIAIGEEMVIV